MSIFRKKGIVITVSMFTLCVVIVACMFLIKPSDAQDSGLGVSEEYIEKGAKYAQASNEYNRIKETSNRFIVFNPVLPTDTEERIAMKTKSDYYANITAIEKAFETYDVVARIFGEQYDRDTVIIEDEQLQIVYFSMIMSILDRGLVELDLFTEDECLAMLEYMLARSTLLTASETIQAYNGMIPRLYEYVSIYRNRYYPERYPDPNAEFSGTW